MPSDNARPAPSLTPASPVDSKDASTITPDVPDTSKTLVLCFDGTGDQFDNDVRASYSPLRRPPKGGGGVHAPVT